MKKRIISVLLAVCMCVQMFPMAFAEDVVASDGGDSAQQDQVETEIPANQAAPEVAEPAQTEELQIQAELEEKSQSVEQREPPATPTLTAAPTTEAAPTPEAMPTTVADVDGALPAATVIPTAAPAAPQAAMLAEGPTEGATVIGTGECGENLTWTEYSNGTLVIEGTGQMFDYKVNTSDGAAPWSDNIALVIIKNGVTSIGHGAFFEREQLSTVEISDSVSTIGNSAFYQCKVLGNINFPESVTSIGASAFADCSGLSNIHIPNTIQSIEIGEDAFSGCTSLTEVAIDGAVTLIAEGAFQGCTNLNSINFPDELVIIGNNAFKNCNSLVSVEIPANVTNIGSHAFEGCNSLSKLVIKGNQTKTALGGAFNGCASLSSAGPIGSNCDIEFSWTTEIPAGAFDGCENLQTIFFPSALTNIGQNVFSHCGFIELKIPDGVTQIGDAAFGYCRNLRKVEIPDSVTEIAKDTFMYCSSLNEIELPQTLTSLGDGAFHYCTSLKQIKLPDSLTKLEMYAFYECRNLEAIYIPVGVDFIDIYTFNNCDSLTDIYYSGSAEEWNDISINHGNDVLNNVIIHYNCTGLDESTNPDIGKLSFSIGTVESAEGNYIIIDGTEYEACFADLPVIPAIMVGRTVVYGLNDDGQVVICSAIQTTTGDITQWDAENSRFFTNVGYCGIKEGVTNNEIFQNPEAFIGSNRCVSYVSLSDGYTIVDIEPVTTVVGMIQNVDVLNDPWQVYLENQAEPYSVDMTDEALQIKLTDLIGQMAVLTLVDNKITYAYTPAEATAVQVRLNIAPNNFVWSNGAYNMDTADATLTILYNPADTFIGDETALSSYSLSINEIDFSLDGMELLTFTGPAQLQPEDSIPFGESRQYSVALQIQNAQLDKEPEDGLTSTLIATIHGEKLGEVVNTSRSAIISITNEDIRNAAEQELEQAEEEASQAAYDAYNSIFTNLSDKITLPPQLNTYLNEEQVESLKVIILSEIAMANAPEEVWTDRLSREVTEKVLSKFLGYTKPDVTADATEIPVSVVVETEEYGSVQIDFQCNLTEFSLSGNEFAIFGSIETTVKLLDNKGTLPQTLQGGMIAKCDINSFAEGVWNVASAQLESGYNKVWGNDADKIANNLMQAGIEKLANTASPYFFQLPVEKILQQLYENEFKDKFSSTMFKILCAPSKIVAAHCPVDLLVYDNENTLVASIENNEITRENEKVALWTVGDSKYVQLFDDSYTISYRATGTGTMDVEITEEANDVSVMRVVSFVDIPLGNGIIYAGMVDDTIQPDESVYALQSNLGSVITPTSVNKPAEEPIPEPEPDPEPVITPTDDPTILNQTFAGGTLDVTKLFELSNDAGAATYTLLDSGTGAGTLISDGTLTVTKAGTFVVQVTTEATDTTAAGSAQVTLTVNKGQGGGTLQVVDTTYPAAVQPTIQNNVSGGTVTYYYNTTNSNQGGTLWTADTILEAGEYWMYAQIAATDLYEAYTTTAEHFTVRSETDSHIVKSFTVTGTPTKTTYDLGEAFDATGLTLTVTYDDGTVETVTSGYDVTPAVMEADTTQVVLSYSGVEAKPITGLTVRENLVSIQAPQAITGLPNGTEKTAKALGLPGTVKITTSRTQQPTTEAAVTWDVENCAYDPNSKSAQTFTVQGTVVLPDGMTNLQNVPLTIDINVEVKAEEIVPAEPEDPSEPEKPATSGNTENSASSSAAATSEGQPASSDATAASNVQQSAVPQTGDPFPAAGLTVLMAASFVAALALAVKRKKKQ